MSSACCILESSHSVKPLSRATRDLNALLGCGGASYMAAPFPHPERAPEEVGRRLRTLREALGISARDMCAALNVAPNTWSQWENGKRMADLSAMSRLWDHFGATLEYTFLGRTDTLPFELAMKVREKLAQSSVGASHGDDDIAPSTAGNVAPDSTRKRKTATRT